MLIPGLRRVQLHRDAVQLGADPDRAMLLQFADPASATLLEHLQTWTDLDAYASAARRMGVSDEDAADMLQLLRNEGLVIDARALSSNGVASVRTPTLTPEASAIAQRRDSPVGPILAARRRQRVFVNGVGETARGVATLLRDAEVGRVWCADDGRRGKATFSIVVNDAQPPVVTSRAHARRNLPHLAVTAMDGSMYVGPLVRPGVTPCLLCVQLHRRDSTHHLPAGEFGGGGDLVEAPLRQFAVAAAVALTLQHLDGDVSHAEAVTVRMRPSLQASRKEWTFHPECGCADR